MCRPPLAAALVLVIGCSDRPPGLPPVAPRGPSAGGPGHTFERGKMLVTAAGPNLRAALTAHLSAPGENELEVFFEAAGGAREPVPVEVFTATATRADGKSFDLLFEPTPGADRPRGEGEEPGEFSHFVAKAPWMTPDDDLTVSAELDLGNRPLTVTWAEFSPKRYARRVD